MLLGLVQVLVDRLVLVGILVRAEVLVGTLELVDKLELAGTQVLEQVGVSRIVVASSLVAIVVG